MILFHEQNKYFKAAKEVMTKTLFFPEFELKYQYQEEYSQMTRIGELLFLNIKYLNFPINECSIWQWIQQKHKNANER